MTIKLFIAFLIFYLHTAIRTINALFPAPHPLFPRISLLQFLPANRTSVTLGDGGDERMWQAIDTPPPRKLCSFTLLCASS